MSGDTGEGAPLFGPEGRIPAVTAVTLTRESGLSSLRKGWLPRHSVAMFLLSPVLFLVYNAATGTGLGDPERYLLLGALSLVGALVLTTYLPLRGAERTAGAPCALMAGLLVPGTVMLLNQQPAPLTGALALTILGLGLWQRVSGTSTCG